MARDLKPERLQGKVRGKSARVSCVSACLVWDVPQPRGMLQAAACTAEGLPGSTEDERDPLVLSVALLTGNKQRSLLIITKSKPNQFLV